MHDAAATEAPTAAAGLHLALGADWRSAGLLAGLLIIALIALWLSALPAAAWLLLVPVAGLEAWQWLGRDRATLVLLPDGKALLRSGSGATRPVRVHGMVERGWFLVLNLESDGARRRPVWPGQRVSGEQRRRLRLWTIRHATAVRPLAPQAPDRAQPA